MRCTCPSRLRVYEVEEEPAYLAMAKRLFSAREPPPKPRFLVSFSADWWMQRSGLRRQWVQRWCP